LVEKASPTAGLLATELVRRAPRWSRHLHYTHAAHIKDSVGFAHLARRQLGTQLRAQHTQLLEPQLLAIGVLVEYGPRRHLRQHVGAGPAGNDQLPIEWV